MDKNREINKEEEIRNQIRKELEREYTSAQQDPSTPLSKHSVDEDVKIQLDLLKKYIILKIEEEIYSQYPEFIKCENYLGEIRWLTLLEMKNDYEFYPVKESRFHRLFKVFKKNPQMDLVDNRVYDDLKNELRESIEEDAKNRIKQYRIQIGSRNEDDTVFSRSDIYKEELDRFYGSKTGYKKYRNHIGEERWMTELEFEKQDEFYEEVIPVKNIVIKWVSITSGILILTVLLLILLNKFNDHEVPSGFVIVNLPENHGNFYINHKLAVGFRPNSPYQLKVGEYELSIIGQGYVSEPRSQNITIKKGDTLTVKFRLIEKEAVEGGMVIIKAPYPDAAIFVNGEFNGPLSERDSMILQSGSYNIVLEKDGYITSPSQQSVDVVVGDTLELTFQMILQSQQRNRSAMSHTVSGTGLIEVRSSVKNADIYLDGKLTPYKTDYVLQKVPFGKHEISVSKKDYFVNPDKHVIVINEQQKSSVVNFSLSSTSLQVKIKTQPVSGTILIDGKKVGYGSYKGRLAVGKHRITFGDVEYYDSPGPVELSLNDDTPEELVYVYKSNFRLEFTPDGIRPPNTSANVDLGYILNGKDFKRGEDAGPEVRQAGIFSSVWWMGYAFEYRNPRGVDALTINFKIPNNIDLGSPIYLKIYGYTTDSDYPLVISGESSYRIVINNTAFKSQIRPSTDLQDANKNTYDSFRINHLLQHGYNRIVIGNMEDASAFMALWKVVVE